MSVTDDVDVTDGVSKKAIIFFKNKKILPYISEKTVLNEEMIGA